MPPNNKAIGLYNHGCVAIAQGHTDDALEFFLGALVVSDDFPDAASNLKYLLANAGKLGPVVRATAAYNEGCQLLTHGQDKAAFLAFAQAVVADDGTEAIRTSALQNVDFIKKRANKAAGGSEAQFVQAITALENGRRNEADQFIDDALLLLARHLLDNPS